MCHLLLHGTSKCLICFYSILQFECKLKKKLYCLKCWSVDMLFRKSPCIIHFNDLDITCAVFSPWDFEVTYVFTQYFNLNSDFYKTVLFKISGLLICYLGQVHAWYMPNNLKITFAVFFLCGTLKGNIYLLNTSIWIQIFTKLNR